MSTHKAGEDEAAVRAVIEEWLAAIRRKDYPHILRNHAPDLLMFDVPPPFSIEGLADYRSTWDLFFRTAANPVVFDVVKMDVTAGSDVAFAAARMRCRHFEKGSTEPSDLDFRLTIGLRKIAGQWTITHEHHSVPAAD